MGLTQNLIDHERLCISCHVGPLVGLFIHSNFLGALHTSSSNVKWRGRIFHQCEMLDFCGLGPSSSSVKCWIFMSLWWIVLLICQLLTKYGPRLWPRRRRKGIQTLHPQRKSGPILRWSERSFSSRRTPKIWTHKMVIWQSERPMTLLNCVLITFFHS